MGSTSQGVVAPPAGQGSSPSVPRMVLSGHVCHQPMPASPYRPPPRPSIQCRDARCGCQRDDLDPRIAYQNHVSSKQRRRRPFYRRDCARAESIRQRRSARVRQGGSVPTGRTRAAEAPLMPPCSHGLSPFRRQRRTETPSRPDCCKARLPLAPAFAPGARHDVAGGMRIPKAASMPKRSARLSAFVSSIDDSHSRRSALVSTTSRSRCRTRRSAAARARSRRPSMRCTNRRSPSSSRRCAAAFAGFAL